MGLAKNRIAVERMAEMLEDLQKNESEGGESPGASRADLHIHSTASDGTDTPRGVLERARKAGIAFVGLTDHDTVTGVRSLKGQVPEDVFLVPGIEFSCKGRAGKCHILGYCCDMDHPSFCRALETGRKLRREKLDRRLTFLEEEEGIRFSREEVDRLYEMVRLGQSVGKPHLGNLLVKYGKATDRSQAIREIINRCPTEESRIETGQAVDAILASGGIPVWAHPMGGEGEERLTWEQFEGQLVELLSYGLKGLECWYSRFPMDLCRQLSRRAREHGLLISGGSDCHGTNKPIQAGTLNAEGVRVPVRRLTILPVLTGRMREMTSP